MAKTIIDFEKGDTSALKEISDALQTIIDKEGSIAEQWKQVLTAMNNGNATAAASTTKVAQGIEQITSEQKDLAAQVNTTGTVTENQNKSNIASNKKLSDSIDEVAQSQKEVAAQTKTTGASLENQNKTSIAGTNKLAQSIEQLSVASKSMDKVVIGGAYKNYLKQIQDQLGLTGKELTNYILNARKAAQAEVLNPSNSKERIDELTLSIQVMNDTLKSMGVTEDGTANKTQTLRTQIRAIKDELVAMADAGLEGTPAFIALQNKAGALDDQMNDLNKTVRNLGSDTKNIDGLISVVSGVAGAYSVAQGAAALFGDENEDVAKALIKVQSAMAILQGLQEISNVLQKESSANLFLNNLLRAKNTAAITEEVVATVADTEATAADAVAKGAQAIATEGATVAAVGLNAALLANPITAVLVGVTALIVAISTLTDDTAEVAAMQQEFNKSLQETGQIIDDDMAIYDRFIARQLAIAKTQGASTAEQIALEGRLNNEKLTNLKKAADDATAAYNKQTDEINQLVALNKKVDKDILQSHDELYKNKEKLDKEYTNLYQEQLLRRQQLEQQLNADRVKSYNAYVQSQVSMTVSGTDQETNAQIKALQQIAAARKAGNDAAYNGLTPGEKFLEEANTEKQIQSLQLQNYQHYLKGRTAAVDAELAIQKAHQATSDADAIASINKITELQIASIKKQRDEQLANPTLNSGERQKAIEDANTAIIEAEKKKQQDILNVQKASLTLQQAATQKGSYEEYVYNLALIENERQAEIAAAGKNKDLIEAIDAKYRKEKQDADIAFNVIQLNNDISRDNAALARFGISEQDKLELTLKRLEDQKAVEIAQAGENAAKIAEIDAKYIQLTREAKIASIDAVKSKELAVYQAYHDEVMKVDQKIADDALLNVNLRVSALEELKREQEQELQIEFNALEKKKGLIEDYDVQYQLLLNKKRDIAENIEKQITQIEKQEIDKRVAQMQSLLDFFKKGFQSILPQNAFSVGLSSLTDFGNSAFKIFANLKQQVSDFNKIIFNPESSSADVLQALADKKIAQTQATQQAEIAATQAAQDIVNQIYADGSAQRQQQLQDDLSALEAERSKELQNTNRTELQKAEINKQFDQKEKRIKLDAWKADQQAKKQTAIINGLLALTRTYAEYGFTPAGIIAAIAQAAATGFIVAEISTQKPPKFRHGKVDIQPVEYKSYTGQVAIKGPGTKTSDSIPALISAGETVIAADPTAKWKEALTAINNDHFEDYLSRQIKSFVFPHIPDDMPMPSGKGHEIDYDRLATAMANKMKGIIPPASHVRIENTMDERGMHAFIQKGNTRTEWKNKRYLS